jgi:hypothetical protein
MNVYFKLYRPPEHSAARKAIEIFYCGNAIESKAIFKGDRYSLSLPPDLDQKMVTGSLEADLKYRSVENGGQNCLIPESLVLSDRYN